MPRKPMHPAERYARDVVRGKVLACKWVKKACKRHLDDLKTGRERGLYFDKEAAQRALDLFELLKPSQGEFAGKRVVMEPWRQFITWVIYGWKRAPHERWSSVVDGNVQDSSGTRRFRTAYVEVARKNGKSLWASGNGIQLAFVDGEMGAHVFAVATKREQARVTHAEATLMVRNSPYLKNPKYGNIQVYRDNLHNPDTASKFEPLGADANTLDGLNIHGAICDEIHAWKGRELWDRIETATSARRQPLIVAITTAGSDRQSLCWTLHEYTEKVLSGVIEDDTWFGIIYTLDEGDNWLDEKVWVKSNPSLGIIKKIDDMRTGAQRACEMPSAQNAFLRFELNVWTQGETKWMNMEHWTACGQTPVDLERLAGRRCFGGLDLSSTLDITAMVWVFPPVKDDENYEVLARFFVPEDNLFKRAHNDRVPYDVWMQQGYITATPGNVVDHKWIYSQIEEDAEMFDVVSIAFDRWGASSVVVDLQEMGFLVVSMGQGYASMSPPMKELERLVASGKLQHGNNPVLTWMADNLVARMDPAGNIKPDKDKSRERIDGMTALIMALDQTLRNAGTGESVYESRGLRVL